MSAACPTGTVWGAEGCNSSVFSKVSQGDGVRRGGYPSEKPSLPGKRPWQGVNTLLLPKKGHVLCTHRG